MNSPKPGKNLRILVVDDNRAIHADFAKILAEERTSDKARDMEATLFGAATDTRRTVRFELDSAYQGRDGLEMVKRALAEGRPYAMAFMDVRMPPGWDGIETTEKIWAVDPEMQIVICTAYSDYSWDQMSDRLGQSDKLVILKKPFDNTEALQLATALTEKWSLARQARSQLQNLERLVEERTGELRAAKELAERERTRYLALFAQAPDGLLGIDPNGTILEANEAAGRLLGQVPKEMEGSSLSAVLSRAGVASEFDLARVTQDQRLLELAVSRDPGSSTSIEVSVQRSDAPRTPSLLVLRDITQRKLIEQRIGHAQRLEAVGQLAGGIAHDFNNLLTAIGGSAELLMTQPDPETQCFAKVILDAQRRGSSLTRQLLAFARRDVHRPTLIDLSATVAGMAKLADRVLGEQHKLQIEKSESLSVNADAAQIEQVFLNLVTNARDSMAGGGTIRFTVRALTASEALALGSRLDCPLQALLEVADAGTGIPRELHAKIFEPFFTTKARGKGTGLGLAAVQGIVVQNQGSISLDSVVGRGTTFRIFFPAQQVAPEAAAPAPASPRSKPGAVGSGVRVLLVDDEDLVRSATAHMLKREGCEVLVASGGAQALALLDSSGPVSVVLTDLAMPGMNGHELSDRIHLAHPRLPVVYMSGYFEEPGSSNLGLVASAKTTNFLPKPFSTAQLVRVLQLAVAG